MNVLLNNCKQTITSLSLLVGTTVSTWPLSTISNETADPGVASSIPATSHTNHEIISMVILILLRIQEGLLTVTRESMCLKYYLQGAQWLSGRVLDSRLRGRRFKPHRHHCVVVLEQDT